MAGNRRFVTLETAAEYAECSTRTLRRHIHDGKLSGYRFGRLVRIDLNELDAFMLPIPPAEVPNA